MMRELIAKKSFLRDRLQGSPEKADFIQRELGNLEGQMDAILLSVEFIENWPGSCVGLCDAYDLEPCSRQNECPRHQC